MHSAQTHFSAPCNASTLPTSASRARCISAAFDVYMEQQRLTNIMQPHRTQRQTDPPHLLPERADDRHLTRLERTMRRRGPNQGQHISRDELHLLLIVEGGAFIDGPIVADDSFEQDGPARVGQALPLVQGRGVRRSRSKGLEGLVVKLRASAQRGSATPASPTNARDSPASKGASK